MTDAKHTPGPWEADGPDVYMAAAGSRLALLAACDDPLSGLDLEEAEANARLIAAAPELFALAQSLQRWLMTDAEPSHVGSGDMRVYHLDGGILSNLLNEARAAIAKAEGRS